jgi:hypothetical protein
MSVFESYRDKAFPYRFAGQLLVPTIAGGTPTDPKVAEGWLKTKLGAEKGDVIRQMVAETMIERGVGVDEATEIVNANQHLNGFKRDDQGLYIDGRQLKAAIKEAVSVAFAVGKLNRFGKDGLRNSFGQTGKGIHGFVAEHIFVTEDRLYLGVAEPTGVMQRFVHTHRGSAIQYEEYVQDARITFTVIADYDFPEAFWAEVWLCGEQQGIGASRSQGFGRYEVMQWTSV